MVKASTGFALGIVIMLSLPAGDLSLII